MSARVLFTTMPSPLDELMLTSDGAALTGLYMTPHQYAPTHTDAWQRDDNAPIFVRTRAQLNEYFNGARRQFDLPLNLIGTDFQKRVWQSLLEIEFGETTSYGELARKLGDAKASRAVGLANGHNPISIIVPCHRVIGANGSLTGYGGGVPRKRALLAFESEVLRIGAHAMPWFDAAPQQTKLQFT